MTLGDEYPLPGVPADGDVGGRYDAVRAEDAGDTRCSAVLLRDVSGTLDGGERLADAFFRQVEGVLGEAYDHADILYGVYHAETAEVERDRFYGEMDREYLAFQDAEGAYRRAVERLQDATLPSDDRYIVMASGRERTTRDVEGLEPDRSMIDVQGAVYCCITPGEEGTSRTVRRDDGFVSAFGVDALYVARQAAAKMAAEVERIKPDAA